MRAYDFFGNKVGSKDCEEGKIFIEPQGFCVMAGIGKDTGHAKKALDSTKELLDTRTASSSITLRIRGITSSSAKSRRIRPDTRKTRASSATITPGSSSRETVVGRGDRAFEYWKKIAPAYLEEISEVHRLEPYVYAQMIAGKDAPRHGEAKNSWLTGNGGVELRRASRSTCSACGRTSTDCAFAR